MLKAKIARLLSTAALGIFILTTTQSQTHAAFFTNGSFENGTNPPPSGFQTLPGGSTNIMNWTTTGGGIDWINNYWQPSNGNYSLDLSGGSAGGIQQTFDTVVGTIYNVSFDLAGNPDGGPIVKSVNVLATGGVTSNYTFDTTGQSRPNMGWVNNNYSFTASSTSTTLTFTSLNNSAFGPALDNVSVTAVPVPAGMLLALTGLPMVGVVGWFRRRVSASA